MVNQFYALDIVLCILDNTLDYTKWAHVQWTFAHYGPSKALRNRVRYGHFIVTDFIFTNVINFSDGLLWKVFHGCRFDSNPIENLC